MYLTREYAPLPKRLARVSGLRACRARRGRAHPRPTCARRCRRHSSNVAWRASADTRPSSARRCRRSSRSSPTKRRSASSPRPPTAAAAAMDELTAWLEKQRAFGYRRLRARRAEISRNAAPDRARRHAARRARAGRPQGSRAQSRGAQGRVRRFAPKASLTACVDKMRANKPSGGIGRRRAGAAPGAAPIRASTRKSSRYRTRSTRWSPSRRHTTAATSRTSAFPARSKIRASRRPTTSRHPTPAGVPPSAMPIYQERPTCCTYPRTRSGRDTTCSRSSRMRIRRAPRHCGRATPSAKGGRTTPKR